MEGPPKIREVYASFCRHFIADPNHNVSAAARKVGKTPTWGIYAMRRPEVKVFVRWMTGQDPDGFYCPKPNARSSKAVVLSRQEVEHIKGVRAAEIAGVPTEDDAARVFNLLRHYMDMGLVELLTDEGVLAIDEEKVRALRGTKLKGFVKHFRHDIRETFDKHGQLTGRVHKYDLETESVLNAAALMAKCLGIDGGNDEERTRNSRALLEALLPHLPEKAFKALHLAALEHSGQILGAAPEGEPKNGNEP